MTTSDEALVSRARRGDRDAWNELVHRHTSMLWNVARGYRLSRSDAADAVQTTWLRCVEQLDRIRDPSCVAGWLATTCRRECLALLRFAGRCAPFDPVDPEAPVRMRLDGDRGGVNPADEVVARAERAAVRTAVSRLPRRQQQVVTALLDEPARGGGYAAVAADLGIPHGSLGPTRKRALRTLARDPSLR